MGIAGKHAGHGDRAREIAARLIRHIENEMAVRGCDYATARAEAVSRSCAGPMTLRLVDQHFAMARAA